jgi:hypothetical protein
VLGVARGLIHAGRVGPCRTVTNRYLRASEVGLPGGSCRVIPGATLLLTVETTEEATMNPIAPKRRLVLATAVVIIAACGLATVALGAAGGVSGTYTTTITKPQMLKGRWTLAFAKGGTYKVILNGRTLGRGTYSATATTVTMREPAGHGCGGSGTYAWRKSRTTMRFTRKREAASCHIRSTVLARPFRVVR